MKQKITSFIREKISDRAMGAIGIGLLCFYYFIGLVSYIATPIRPIMRLLGSSSPLSVALRAFTCALIVLFSIIIIIKYKPKIKWAWLVLLGFALLMTLFSILISPAYYDYMFVESAYKVVHVVHEDPGAGRTIIMFLSSVADFLFAFCIMFVLPYVVNDKKKLLWLLLPIIIIGVLECGYSALKEKDIYLYMFNNPDDPFGGYNNGVGATFGNKEDWGSFLMVAIASSFASIFFLGKTIKEKIIKIFIGIAIVVMSVFVVISLCKTAILALILCLLILFIGLIVYYFGKNLKIGIILLSTLFVAIAFVVYLLTTNGFNIPFLGKIAKYINSLIISKTGNALDGRASLWINYMENIRGYNLFFGMGKTYVNSYTNYLFPEGQSTIHNGLAYFFASYGLIGFMIFISLLCIVIYRIIMLWKINKLEVFLFMALVVSCLIFVLAEAEVLIISTSTPIFVFNVLTVILPAGILIKNRKESVQNA